MRVPRSFSVWVGVVLLSASLLLAGKTQPAYGVLSVNGLRIMGDQGNVRASLGMSENGEQVGLSLFDADGAVRVFLAVNDAGVATVNVNDIQGRPAASVVVEEDGKAGVALFENGRPGFGVGVHPDSSNFLLLSDEGTDGGARFRVDGDSARLDLVSSTFATAAVVDSRAEAGAGTVTLERSDTPAKLEIQLRKEPSMELTGSEGGAAKAVSVE